jgi:hypothetical protein
LQLQAAGEDQEPLLEHPGAVPSGVDMIFLATLLQLVRWAEPFDLEVD